MATKKSTKKSKTAPKPTKRKIKKIPPVHLCACKCAPIRAEPLPVRVYTWNAIQSAFDALCIQRYGHVRNLDDWDPDSDSDLIRQSFFHELDSRGIGYTSGGYINAKTDFKHIAGSFEKGGWISDVPFVAEIANLFDEVVGGVPVIIN